MPTYKRVPGAADPNVEAAALLYDMAALQPTERSRFGYKRAARAVIALPVPVTELVASGRLRDVPYIGPSSARIITEFVTEGTSRTVEAALARSGKAPELHARRGLRATFLSQHAMEGAHALRIPKSIVSRASFRGDLQMHSTWSDGAERVENMAEACLALGHAFMGITDHSYGLPVARGMSMETALEQQREVDRLNQKYGGRLRIFKGIEANIRADGTTDLSPEECRMFEYVVAAPHAVLRRIEDQTRRMLTAVRTPGVAILGHPRGRMYNSRPGVSADWRKVFAEAARHGVAIELDGNWHRQDIDWELAGIALEEGCIFALDSDAHSIPELRFTDYSIAHARLARIPAERVINCWPDSRLMEWMGERRDGGS